MSYVSPIFDALKGRPVYDERDAETLNMAYRKPTIKRQTFANFRTAWGPRASLHLTRVKPTCETNPIKRFHSFLWLLREKVPLNGAAPSMNFKGL